MDVSFEGFRNNVITFMADSKLDSGRAVSVTGNGRVGYTQSGGAFIGIVVNSDDSHAAVLVQGVAEMPCTDDLDLGLADLSVDGDGRLINGSISNLVNVLSYDSTAKTAVILI